MLQRRPEAGQDGRHVDEGRGLLAGEAAQVRVMHPDEAFPVPEAEALPVSHPPIETHASTYYSTPALKPPVWKAWIPLYFYVGGVAGSSAVLSAAASLRGPGLRRLTRRGRTLALLGTLASAVLLIVDLGRPSRFLNMLRVFRPTSPMSVGTWILTPLGGLSSIAVLAGHRPGALGRIGSAAGIASGVLGLPMSSYTAVLLANTAVPVWTEARRTLPWLFAASSISSAGALLELLPSRRSEAAVLRRFSILGRAAELGAAIATEREIGRGRVGRALHEGRAGRLWTSAKVLGVASLGLSLVSGRSRAARILGATAATAAALLVRFAVSEAGKGSARDPHASLPRRRRTADVAGENGTRRSWKPTLDDTISSGPGDSSVAVDGGGMRVADRG